MLFERWRQIAGAYRDQLALRDLAGGGRWTFGELAAAAENGAHDTQPVAFPQNASADFIFGVLLAWRSGRVVCPLEAGQPAPSLPAPLPRGIVHLKTTSATTGTPQMVAFTAAQLMADAENIVA